MLSKGEKKWKCRREKKMPEGRKKLNRRKMTRSLVEGRRFKQVEEKITMMICERKYVEGRKREIDEGK